jgi:regulator of protease activity HflC (stomatin/prohibitin superfamily)
MAKYPESLDGKPPPPKRRGRWWYFFVRHLPSVSLAALVTALGIVVLWPYMVITVPSGSVGVLWHRFLGFDPYCWCFINRGTALNPRELREEGLHLIAPWNKLFIYDLRLQSTTQTFNAISKDGVSVTAQINVRYQLVHNSVGVLHKFIGPDYARTILIPEIGSQARQIISQYSAQEVYTSRDRIQGEIRESAQRTLAAKLNELVQPQAMEEPNAQDYRDFLQDAILILDTLVLGIELPPQIVAAINRQTEQYYMIQEYRYRVEREAQESKRKMIEANGIAAFQKTVSQGISDSYLRWRGIEATLALAQSSNSKIVIIGSGKDGLPIILGNVESPPTSAAPQPGGSGAPPPATVSPGATNYAPPGTAGTPVEGESATTELPGGPGNGSPPPTPGAAPTVSAPPGSTGRDKAASSSGAVDLFDIKSILSRIYGGAPPRGAATAPGPGSRSNQ